MTSVAPVAAPLLPYWRLSSFYFFYFAILGAFIPYWGLYLESLNFSAKEIGFFAAIVMGTKIVAPNIWGWLADKTGQRLRIVRLGSLLAFVSFSAIFLDKSFWSIALVMVLYSFFWNAVLAQFEVITLGHMRKEPENYSKVRVWGSVGFVVFVFALGYVFDVLSLSNLPYFLSFLFFALWLSSLVVPKVEVTVEHESAEGFWQVVKKPPVLAFFFACFMMQIAHGPYYSFFSIYMDGYGYSHSAIGQLWSLGVIAEVVLFLFMHRIMGRYSLRFIMVASLLIASVRWLMIAYCPESLVMMLIAQVFHAFTFGSFHAASIELVRRYFGGGHAGQGQAIYSAVSFGLGGCIGSLYSGFLWEHDAGLTFVVSSVVCFIAAIVAYVGIKKESYSLA